MGPASPLIASLTLSFIALVGILKKVLRLSLFIASVLAVGQLRVHNKVIGEHFLDGIKSLWSLAGTKLNEKGISIGAMVAPQLQETKQTVREVTAKAMAPVRQAIPKATATPAAAVPLMPPVDTKEIEARDREALRELFKGN